MRTIELIKPISHGETSELTCLLHDDDDVTGQSTCFAIDSVTSAQLAVVIKKYPNSRYHISSNFQRDAKGEYWGTVSAIHARWLIYVTFHASEMFLDKMRSMGAAISVQKQAVTTADHSREVTYFAEDGRHGQQPVGDGESASLRRYIPGLDGLRAIAVMAIILYHINTDVLPGGFLGVTLFFVLSGYLITSLLMSEWSNTGRVDIRNFWIRRIRRLLPALYCMLGVVLLYVAIFYGAHLIPWSWDALSSLLYLSNWWFVFHHVSYFNRFGTPTPFGHLWSLSIEEQFYFVWPFVIMLVFAVKPKSRVLVPVTFSCAVLSALLMLIIYQPGFDPSRVYYGTDTHAFSLLIGATLAMLLARQRRSRHLRETVTTWTGMLIDFSGTIALFAVISCFWWMGEYSNLTYRGGMFLLSVMAAILIGTITRRRSRLERLLGWQPLRWLGRRSYGIYLWHYPVIVLTRPPMNVQGVSVLRAVLQIVASIILAALSWKFVEEPLRRRAIRQNDASVKTHAYRRIPRALRLSTRGSVVAVMSLVVATGGFVFPTLNDDMASSVGSQQATLSSTIGPVLANTRNHVSDNQTSVSVASSPASRGLTKIEPKSDSSEAPKSKSVPLNLSPTANPSLAKQTNTAGRHRDMSSYKAQSMTTSAMHSTNSHLQITAVGDSVMVDIEPYLKKVYPTSVVDGKVGRQMWQASSVFHQLQAKHDIHHDVVIELGTNGPFPKQELISLLKFLGPNRQIFVANTRVPRSWQDHVNQILSQVVESYPNVTLINWYDFSAGKESYFSPDGVHLTPGGAKQYASLIQQAIRRKMEH